MSNESLANQLGAAFGRTSPEHKSKKKSKAGQGQGPNRKAPDADLPRPSRWVGDGLDHTNVSPRGTTELGRTLHPSSLLTFTHDKLGAFVSISAFWDFMVTGGVDTRMRGVSNYERQRMKKKIGISEVKNLNFFLADATWQRVNQYETLKEIIANHDHPFDYYIWYTDNPYPCRVLNQWWIVESLEKIRIALREGVEPDFSNWMEGKTRDELFAEYFATYPNITGQVRQEVTENNLLESLRRSKITSQSSGRRPRHIHGANDVPLAKKNQAEPLKTTASVEVPEELQNEVLQKVTGAEPVDNSNEPELRPAEQIVAEPEVDAQAETTTAEEAQA